MKKFALVCGASGAIGSAIASKLAADGWSLYLHYGRNEQIVKDLYHEFVACYPQQEFFIVQADLNDSQAAANIAKQIFTLHAIVFANGQAAYGLLEDHTPEQMQALWQVHVQTPAQICQLLASKLRQHETSYITFISSIWGEAGASGEVMYSAVKGAQNSFVKAYAKEVAYNGIRVNAVAPGIVDTVMNAHLNEEEQQMILDEIPLNRYAQPNEIASFVAFLQSGQADYITGQVHRINGGWHIG